MSIFKRSLKRPAWTRSRLVNAATDLVSDPSRECRAAGTVLGRGSVHGPVEIVNIFEKPGGNRISAVRRLGLPPVELHPPLGAAGPALLTRMELTR